MLFRLNVMSKLKQAPAMEFRSPENSSTYLKDWHPLVDPCTCSSAVFGDFVPLGYPDWSEDIVKPRCGVHKAQGSVAMTEKKRCGKGGYFPPLVGPLPSAILKDFFPPLPCANMMGNQLQCVYYVLCNCVHIHCSDVTPAPSGPGSLSPWPSERS